MHNQELGRRGEDVAADFLLKLGFKIVARNYRVGRLEVDIIAIDKRQRELVFVEVKARCGLFFSGEDAIDKNKSLRIGQAAVSYAQQKGWKGELRVDGIVVVFQSDGRLSDVEHYCNIS
jgi:putative endonuclease